MTLVDKLHALASADPEADLLDFLGVGPGGLTVGPDELTVGAESVPLGLARAIVLNPPVRPTGPVRSVTIEDL